MATKVVVDFVELGGTMVSREEERKSPKTATVENTMYIGKTLRTKEGTKYVSKPLTSYIRKTIDVHRSQKLDVEQYNAMMQTPNGFIKPNKWKSMSKKQRLASYLDDLAHDYGSKSYTFEILDD